MARSKKPEAPDPAEMTYEQAIDELESIIDGVLRRVQAVEIYDRDVQLRVFVCHDHDLYSRFARLSRVPTRVPATARKVSIPMSASTPI